MVDTFSASSASLDSPGENWEQITPHDTNELDPIPRALWIGGAGNLELTGKDDVDATFEAVPAGTLLPVRAHKVKSTGTTATLIVSIW